MRSNPARKTVWLHLVLLVSTIAITYFNSLGNGYNLDDKVLFVKNTATHGFSLSNLKALFTSVTNNLEYLPVRDLTYCLDYLVWGSNPFGYHLDNLLYYVAACLFLYFFLIHLFARWTDQPETPALLSVLLFALHPVHVEVVAGISQRKDILTGIFAILSLRTFLSYREKGRISFYLASLGLFILALFSKATVITFPLLLPAMGFLLPERNDTLQRKAWQYTPFFLVAIAYYFIQGTIMTNTTVLTQSHSAGFAGILATAVQSLAYYLKILFIPYPLFMSHPFYRVETLFDLKSLLSLVLCFIILYLVFRFRKTSPPVSLSLYWFLVFLIPVTGIVATNAGYVVAERYLFLPSAGFCILCGWLVTLLARWDGGKLRVPAMIMLTTVCLIFSGISHFRNKSWIDFISLVNANIRDLPRELKSEGARKAMAQLHVEAGLEYYNKQQDRLAMENFSTARSIMPATAVYESVFNAIRNYELGRPDLAMMQLGQLDKKDSEGIYEVNLLNGHILAGRNDYAGARSYYQRAVSSNSVLGFSGGQKAEAAEILKSLPEK